MEREEFEARMTEARSASGAPALQGPPKPKAPQDWQTMLAKVRAANKVLGGERDAHPVKKRRG